MNTTICPTKVLDYYDGVLVFTAEDHDGQRYVGSIIDTTDGIDRYLVKGATPERIKDLENGRIDLRSLLLEHPDDGWHLTFDGHAPDQPLELHPQDGSLEATDFLPSDGYFLGEEETEMQPPAHRKMAAHQRGLHRSRARGRCFGRPPSGQSTSRLVVTKAADFVTGYHRCCNGARKIRPD